MPPPTNDGPKPKKQGPPGGGPPQGPPMGPQMGPPGSSGQPGADPLSAMMGGMGPGMGMPPMMPMMPPGVPKPGQTMDPMQAMLQGMPQMPGMGLPPPMPPPGAPMGEGGLPVGGSDPSLDPNFAPEMGGSDLMQGLSMAIGDPYSAGPMGHASLQGMGPEDPNMGLDQLIQLIAMAQSGAGPGMDTMPPQEFGPPGIPQMGVRPGGSGVGFDRGRYGTAPQYGMGP